MKRILRNKGARTGIFFGATSGVITTIGLIVGLHAGTQSMVAVLGGILVVAFADRRYRLRVLGITRYYLIERVSRSHAAR